MRILDLWRNPFCKPSEKLNCIIMPHKYPSVGFFQLPNIIVYRQSELNLKGRSEEPKTIPEGGKRRPKPCWFGPV